MKKPRTATKQGHGLGRTDFSTLLGGLADRLRLHALALRGMAHLEGDSTAPEARTKTGMAGDLDDAAARLDLVRGSLCADCRLLELVERIEVERGQG